jgi:hypothetical protein
LELGGAAGTAPLGAVRIPSLVKKNGAFPRRKGSLRGSVQKQTSAAETGRAATEAVDPGNAAERRPPAVGWTA